MTSERRVRIDHISYQIRQVLIKNQSYICFRCGKISVSLVVHHINYPARNSDDLILLCKSCHKKVHDGALLHPIYRRACLPKDVGNGDNDLQR